MIDLKLIENESSELNEHIDSAMDKVIKHFEHELASVRTGRANTAMVEDIIVSCYEGSTHMPLKNIATLSAPDARMIVIQPWDKATLPDVEKAIFNSDVGITPANDGNLIRLQLPEMSGTRREELIKVLHKKLEDSKIGVRNVRKDFHNFIRDAERKKTISEDFSRRLNDLLQKITDQHIKKVEEMSDKKEKELRPN
ncbi:ribosome recycling factor [bacterium]|jgi:ribosome recycling factor|nr:ribosome recycling factor [bacterium]